MNILLNDEPQTVADNSQLIAALEQLGIETQGVAVAVNNEILPPDTWPDIALKDQDELVVFKLIAGG